MPATCENCHMAAALTDLDIALFNAAWQSQWPGADPIGYELRGSVFRTGSDFTACPNRNAMRTLQQNMTRSCTVTSRCYVN